MGKPRGRNAREPMSQSAGTHRDFAALKHSDDGAKKSLLEILAQNRAAPHPQKKPLPQAQSEFLTGVTSYVF
jgi:hypothetical protein